MKKKLLYFMFAAVALCVACGDEDETFQREGVENPVTGISIENEFLEDGVISRLGSGRKRSRHSGPAGPFES